MTTAPPAERLASCIHDLRSNLISTTFRKKKMCEKTDKGIVPVVIYVDDLIISDDSGTVINEVKLLFKDFGELPYFFEH